MRRIVLSTVIAFLAGCATLAADPTAALQGADVATRTESNGDVISEYRVGGQLRIVKITPRIGVTYYLVDDDSDGRLDRRRGEGPISPVNYKLAEW